MINTVIVSEQYLKANAPTTQGIDAGFLRPHVEVAQEIYTQQLLGTELYNDIISKYAAQTLNTEEAELVNILKRSLVFRAIEMGIPFLSAKTTAQGTVTAAADTFQPISKSTMEFLMNEMKTKAAFFEERAIKYIQNNIGSFPLYQLCQEDVNPVNRRDPYSDSCGIHFSRNGYGWNNWGYYGGDCGC